MPDGELGCEQGPVTEVDRWCDAIEMAPAAIALAMLGLLGGICGEPVSIWLRDFDSDVTCAVQRWLLAHLLNGQVCEVVGRSDLGRLTREVSQIVVAIVDPIQARRSVSQEVLWSIARRRGSRTPAVLLASESGLADSPGAMLALRGSPDELARTRDWLLKHPEPDHRMRTYFSRLAGTTTIVDYCRLAPVIAPTNGPAAWRPKTLRSLETLRGLLAGRALIREVLAGANAPQLIVPSLEDYNSVYTFLQGPAVGVPEEASDPLLEAMVGRANLYMDHQANRGCSQAFKRGREGFASRVIRASNRAADRDRLISLRELADLGLARSPLLESLIDAVARSGDPEKIRRMGLVREVSDERCLQGHSPEELRAILAWWSMKQVYSRFDKLRRQGFLEALRSPSNGPLWLELPEELKGLPAEFQGLPSPERAEGLIAGSVPPA